jgi:hypothetical protein
MSVPSLGVGIFCILTRWKGGKHEQADERSLHERGSKMKPKITFCSGLGSIIKNIGEAYQKIRGTDVAVKAAEKIIDEEDSSPEKTQSLLEIVRTGLSKEKSSSINTDERAN